MLYFSELYSCVKGKHCLALANCMTFVVEKPLFWKILLLLLYRYAIPRVQWEMTSDEEEEAEDPLQSEDCDAEGQELKARGAEEVQEEDTNINEPIAITLYQGSVSSILPTQQSGQASNLDVGEPFQRKNRQISRGKRRGQSRGRGNRRTRRTGTRGSAVEALRAELRKLQSQLIKKKPRGRRIRGVQELIDDGSEGMEEEEFQDEEEEWDFGMDDDQEEEDGDDDDEGVDKDEASDA